MAKSRNAWRVTLIPVFQPTEETGAGAKAMIDDGLFKRFPKPTPMLGQHIINAGTIADLPTNHNPRFAPVIHPTLEAGIETLVVACQAWLTT